MHEFAICRALLEQVEHLAGAHGHAAVRRVTVQVGPLSGVEPRLLGEAFGVARLGGCARDAELTIRSMPVRVRCLLCDAESDVPPNRLLCDRCGSYRTRVTGGDELLLRRVEFASEQTPA